MHENERRRRRRRRKRAEARVCPLTRNISSQGTHCVRVNSQNRCVARCLSLKLPGIYSLTRVDGKQTVKKIKLKIAKKKRERKNKRGSDEREKAARRSQIKILIPGRFNVDYNAVLGYLFSCAVKVAEARSTHAFMDRLLSRTKKNFHIRLNF